MTGISNIGLSDRNIDVSIGNEIILGSSSRGNQSKWNIDGKYIKADYLGYEGLAEVLISNLASFTNIPDVLGIVAYNLCTIKTGGRVVNGCICNDFKTFGISEDTLERLHTKMVGKELISVLKNNSTQWKIEYVVDFLNNVAGIQYAGEIITLILEFDALVLNEDRHTNNIALITDKNGDNDFAPLFDFGAGLLSDTSIAYPIGISPLQYISKVKSKPFNTSFKKQVDTCRRLYGRQLEVYFNIDKFNWNCLDSVDIYSEEIKRRALLIIRYQLKKWFKGEI